MTKVVQIRMGGYGPPTTTFNRALRIIGDGLERRFGDRIEVKYVWNVMDLGHRSEDLWRLVEQGSLTLAYLSTSGLSGRIPELGMADLPFLFESETAARAAIDGAFGSFLAGKIEAEMNYRVLGFFENGFRQISNCLHQVRMPSDLAGMKIRILNSKSTHALSSCSAPFQRMLACRTCSARCDAATSMRRKTRWQIRQPTAPTNSIDFIRSRITSTFRDASLRIDRALIRGRTI